MGQKSNSPPRQTTCITWTEVPDETITYLELVANAYSTWSALRHVSYSSEIITVSFRVALRIWIVYGYKRLRMTREEILHWIIFPGKSGACIVDGVERRRSKETRAHRDMHRQCAKLCRLWETLKFFSKFYSFSKWLQQCASLYYILNSKNSIEAKLITITLLVPKI